MRPSRKYVLVLLGLLVLSAVAHGFNMFSFPYYENDEGVYMSQAWSLLTQGKLAPYTYWYDHAPLGWIFIALWVKLTGGFYTFGPAINSGRVLMFVLHAVTVIMLFEIARRLSKGLIAGTIAVLFFSLSPLAIYFQRRVLLDNIMIFWVFLSLILLLQKKIKLKVIILSGLAFGAAVLTKENAIFLLPAYLHTIFMRSEKHNRNFALIMWLTVAGLLSSTYFLYAILKGEFFPEGTFGNIGPHVSLLSTSQFHLSRGSGLPFWDARSDFWGTLSELYSKDPMAIMVGIVSTLLSLALSVKIKRLRTPAFFALMFWIFLIRGKLVLSFYIIPLIPLLALNIGMIFDTLARKIGNNTRQLNYLAGIGILMTVISPLMISRDHFVKNETAAQIEAVSWVRENVSRDAYIVIDNYAYLDLRRDGGFENADWYFKLLYDPAISEKFGPNFENTQYFFLSHNMLNDFRTLPGNRLKDVFAYSFRLQQWQDGSAYVNIDNYLSTYGDWGMLYKVKDKEQINLQNMWENYKKEYVHSYGKVIDPTTGNTTSEGQSYAMLRAIWTNDQEGFDGVWAWTADHMQHRLQDKLFSWLWVTPTDDTNGKQEDSASAADADQDIALALLFAYRQWGDEKYLAYAQQIIKDIWRQEVVQINNRYYLTLGAGVEQGGNYLVNPSYLSPAAYRIFAEVDGRPWDALARDSYSFLNDIGSLSGTHLPPDWVQVDRETGEVAIPNPTYGFDSFRTMCRVALDYMWFGQRQAFEYLNSVEPFYRSQFENSGMIKAVYSTNGNPLVDYESISTNAGPLCTLIVANPQLATNFYESRSWNAGSNYYDQNWAWFAAALKSGNMKNLWK